MKSACVGVLSIIELKDARWNIEKYSSILMLNKLSVMAFYWNLFHCLSLFHRAF